VFCRNSAITLLGNTTRLGSQRRRKAQADRADAPRALGFHCANGGGGIPILAGGSSVRLPDAGRLLRRPIWQRAAALPRRFQGQSLPFFGAAAVGATQGRSAL